MKHKKHGVSLIECIVYIGLFSFIAMTSFQLFANFYQPLMQCIQTSNAQTDISLAADLLTKDVRAASTSALTWHVTEPNSIVWRNQIKGKDIGWAWHKNRLMRYEGVYNAHANQWGKKTQSVALQKIDTVLFHATHTQNGILDSIAYTIGIHNGYTCSGVVHPRNKVYT